MGGGVSQYWKNVSLQYKLTYFKHLLLHLFGLLQHSY